MTTNAARGAVRKVPVDPEQMTRVLRNPPYNLLIHSAPLAEPAGDYYHWHVEVIPKLTKVAGFEWATGFYVNPTSPEEASQVLRDARG